jgi:hypothetical protein
VAIRPRRILFFSCLPNEAADFAIYSHLFYAAGVWLVRIAQPTQNPAMKNTLRLLLSGILLSFSMTSLLCAEDQPVPVQSATLGGKPLSPPGMNSQQILQVLSGRLNLTNDQKAQILPILQAQENRVNAIHGDTSLSDDERREKMLACVRSAHEQIRAVLTLDQQAKLVASPDMNPQQMAKILSEQLSLTDDQKAEVARILQTHEDQISALAKDASLSADERREKIRDILQSTGRKIRALLTPEQMWEFRHPNETMPLRSHQEDTFDPPLFTTEN